MQKNRKRNKRPPVLLKNWRLLAAGAAAVIVLVVVFTLVLKKDVPKASTEAGIAYIHKLERTDSTPVEDKIKELKKQERREALENGELDVWQQFSDAAILGDSRAVGFYTYGFVEERRVMANAGATLKNIPDYIPRLQNVNPLVCFLCFGLNDISIGYWDTVDEYIEELDAMIELIRTSVPGIEVYVNSTIPATDPAFEQSDKWRNIPEWNAAIKAQCEENGIHYVDVSATVEEHKDLYDIDGIHMQKAFYEYWAVDMIAEVNDEEENAVE